MSPQAMELQIIRTDARISNANFSHGAALTPSEAERAILHRNMLLDYVDELTTQRDDARRIAIAAFTDTFVAWERQVEQS